MTDPSRRLSSVEVVRRAAQLGLRGVRSVARVPLRSWPRVAQVLGVWSFVELGLRFVPLPRLSAVLGVPLSITTPDPDPAVRVQWSGTERARMALAIKVLRHRPLDGTCLRRSLVVGHLIRHRQPQLCIGAKKTAGRVLAHAWLEIDGAFVDVEEPELAVADDWRRF